MCKDVDLVMKERGEREERREVGQVRVAGYQQTRDHVISTNLWVPGSDRPPPDLFVVIGEFTTEVEFKSPCQR